MITLRLKVPTIKPLKDDFRLKRPFFLVLFLFIAFECQAFVEYYRLTQVLSTLSRY